MNPVMQKKSALSARPPERAASGFSKAAVANKLTAIDRMVKLTVVASLIFASFGLTAQAETGGTGGGGTSTSSTTTKAPTTTVQSEKQKEAAARAAEAAAAKKKQFNETMDAYQSSVDKLTAQYHELQGKYDHCRDDYASKLRFVQRCTALTMGMCSPFFIALRWYRSKHPCNQFSEAADQVYKALTELKGSRPDFDFASDFPSTADLDNTPIPDLPIDDKCPEGTNCTSVTGPTTPGDGTGNAGHTTPNGPIADAGGDGGSLIKQKDYGSRGYGAGGSTGGMGGGGPGGGAGLGSGLGNSMTGNGADPSATPPLVGGAAGGGKGKDLSFGGGGGSIGGGGRGGLGGGGDGGAGFDSGYGSGGAGGKRGTASVAGLSKKLKSGESIGVQGDNIFHMISRTYQEKAKQNSFNINP